MSRRERGLLGTAGGISWLAGVAATFADGGAGSPALIIAGMIAGGLALMGRWPTRVVVSGHEMSWSEVNSAIREQVEVAEDSGDESAARLLIDLQQRLAEWEKTGAIPAHPAARYDGELKAAISRLLPGAEIVVPEARSRDTPDLEVKHGGRTLLIETKFKRDSAEPFRGGTLQALLSGMGGTDRLLVVSNSNDVRAGSEVVRRKLDGRGRVVMWRGPIDDAELASAVRSLLQA